MVVIVISIMTALSYLFQLVAPLLRLTAMVAMFVNGPSQVVLSFVDSFFALPVPVGCDGKSRAARQHKRRDQRGKNFQKTMHGTSVGWKCNTAIHAVCCDSIKLTSRQIMAGISFVHQEEAWTRKNSF